MTELKKLVGAVLFSVARKIELSELAKLCKKPEEEVLEVLKELQKELEAEQSPTILIQEGTAWRLTVREKYAKIVKKVVTKTELAKSVLETLAVVAYKAPVLQSDVIKIRTNKAYDHLDELEKAEFITREKSGRTKLIRLSQKFYDYFDISHEKLQKRFESLGDVEKAIEAKEKEIDEFEEDQIKKAKQPAISVGGKPLETVDMIVPVDELEPTGIEVVKEKVGDLEVYDAESETVKPEREASSDDVEDFAQPLEGSEEVKQAIKQVRSEFVDTSETGDSEETEISESDEENSEKFSEEREKSGEVAEDFVKGELEDSELVVEEPEEIVQPEIVEDSTAEKEVEFEEQGPAGEEERKGAEEKEVSVTANGGGKFEGSVNFAEPEGEEHVVIDDQNEQEESKASPEFVEKVMSAKHGKAKEHTKLFSKTPPEMDSKIEEKIKRLLTGEKAEEEQ
ncbi:SMC-Scp complex subunit ScpB [Candidatus Woesearchaeota archaeon CG10_big_fil_rev_8_21_14_0_10_37_12]|nr:MAG: SMC-Scp complex subunit ScpB [Candidatus Woesearchaeota archaeon CG10_big_fil_rev_8_21_14_0_10_37_12]